MADAEHLKLDDGTVIDIADAVARQKVGSAELQTTAKDCSGAINELKQSLTNTSASSTTAGLTVKKEANIVMVTFGNLTLASGETKVLAQQIPVGYRPSDSITLFGKTYNGSAYVDCRIVIRNTGVITIDALTGADISGLQPQYIYPKDVTYIIN